MTSPSGVTLQNTLADFFAGQPEVLEWGIVPLNRALPNADNLESWVGQGMHAGLRYMEENLDKRTVPRQLFPWACSAVLFSLRQSVPFGTPTGDFRVAAYALGEDYHRRARRILNEAHHSLSLSTGAAPLRFESFCDTWPVFERDLAAEAGLGWRGKNSCLIHRKHGSGFMLAGFFLDVDFEAYSTPQEDFCGGCTACLEACPTNAFVAPGRLDASKCLSYWTIEAKGDVPSDIAEKSGSWIFGCDVCQEVCPWNHKHIKKSTTSTPKNLPQTGLDWLTLLRKGGGFQSRFKDSPLTRAGRRSLLRNVLIALRNNPQTNIRELVETIGKEESNQSVESGSD
jgi:epoxyqueuosine reductase